MMLPPPPPNPIAATLAAIAALDPEVAEFIRLAINANARLHHRTSQRGLLSNRAILFSHVERLIPDLAGTLRATESLANRRYHNYLNKRRDLEMLQQRLKTTQAKYGLGHEKTRAVVAQLDTTIQQLAAA